MCSGGLSIDRLAASVVQIERPTASPNHHLDEKYSTFTTRPVDVAYFSSCAFGSYIYLWYAIEAKLMRFLSARIYPIYYKYIYIYLRVREISATQRFVPWRVINESALGRISQPREGRVWSQDQDLELPKRGRGK